MSINDEVIFKNTLVKNGHRITSARLATFKLLYTGDALSMNELLALAKGKVDRVSVYRCLDLFEKLGIVHRIHMGWKYKFELSDTYIAHHHHMTCLSCGKVYNIEDEKHIEEFIHRVATSKGFTPRRHTFEVDGYCANCKNTD